FLIEFAWAGTGDPSPYLAVPEALRFMGELLPGGWREIRRRNHALTVRGRELLTRALGISDPCPPEMLGSLAALPIPDGDSDLPPISPLYLDALQEQLFAEDRIEVPIVPWPAPPRRLLRISAQVYNSLPQYEQ